MGHEQGRLRGVEGRHERVAAEDAGQSVNGAHGVLAGGGEVASNSTERYCQVNRFEDLLIPLTTS